MENGKAGSSEPAFFVLNQTDQLTENYAIFVTQ